MKSTVRGIVFAALFAALLSVLSFFSINLPYVPITLENMAVMLAGAILGPLYGFISMALVVALTAIGLPMLHGAGGLGVILGPTGGYVWAWPICAFLIGWFVKRVPLRGGISEFALITLIVFVPGDLLSYVTGVGWLMHVVPTIKTLNQGLVAGAYPFIPGDFIKSLVVAGVTMRVRRVFPMDRITGRASSVVRMDRSAS